jgi:hypothetical protein
VLPYLSPRLRGEKLLAGANFASAGIGILNDTGIQFVSFLASIVYNQIKCKLWLMVINDMILICS